MSDLDARSFINTGKALTPSDFMSEEFLSELPKREVMVTIRRARHPEHHRWFMKLLSRVVSNTDDKWADIDDLLDDLKLACGHYTRRANILTGEIQYVAKSINFASMGEDKFRRFKDRALYVLAKALGYDPLILMEGERGVVAPSIAPEPDHRVNDCQQSERV